MAKDEIAEVEVTETEAGTEAEKPKKARNYVHVPFDRMTCPVEGCSVGPGGGPQEGTIPGIKRHVRSLHPEQYEKIEWPPLRANVPDDASSLTDELAGTKG